MAKGKTSVFFCQECGYESAKWMGQCPACKEWNTFVEETVDKKSISSSGKVKKESKAVQVLPLSAVKSEKEERIVTGIAEFDRVLGGGIVRGSLVLVGGDPGIGKSTLLLQVCMELSQKKVLYFLDTLISTESTPSSSTLKLSLPPRFVFIVPATAPAISISYSVSSSRPRVI